MNSRFNQLPPGRGSEEHIAPGRRFGKYELLKHIATGGMAEIYLARTTGLQGFEKLVVIKRILPSLSHISEITEMFLDEARLAATLYHGNIVQVFDIGIIDGHYFFTMEFLHGEDLRSILKQALATGNPLPIEHAVLIVLGVCAGLHYAHEKLGLDGRPLNLVHRDVSLQNVFVTYDGGIKLVDFGIAKASHRLTETRHGTLKGKLHYMAPEQCRSEALDRRSDVFALSVVLWEITIGERLYKGPGDFEILKEIVEVDARRPSEVRPDYPPELEQIVMKGLRRDREERYQTIQEMQLALEHFAREHKLVLSPVALARYMRELFGEKIVAWLEAQRQGKLFPAEEDHEERTPLAADDGIADAVTSSAEGVGASASSALHSDEGSLFIPRTVRPWHLGVGAVVLGAILLAFAVHWRSRAAAHEQASLAHRAPALAPAPKPLPPPVVMVVPSPAAPPQNASAFHPAAVARQDRAHAQRQSGPARRSHLHGRKIDREREEAHTKPPAGAAFDDPLPE